MKELNYSVHTVSGLTFKQVQVLLQEDKPLLQQEGILLQIPNLLLQLLPLVLCLPSLLVQIFDVIFRICLRGRAYGVWHCHFFLKWSVFTRAEYFTWNITSVMYQKQEDEDVSSSSPAKCCTLELITKLTLITVLVTVGLAGLVAAVYFSRPIWSWILFVTGLLTYPIVLLSEQPVVYAKH